MLRCIALALLIAAAPTLARSQGVATGGTPTFDSLNVVGSATLSSVVTPSLVLGGFTLTGVGTTAGTLAAGNDARIVGAAQNAAAAITGGTINGVAIGNAAPATGVFSTLSVSGSVTFATPLPLSQGGCGATSAAGCRTSLALGGAALLNVGTTTGTVAAGDDSRITGALQSSTAAATYAPLASPAFTGTPTVPTAAAGTNTAQIASTAFVINAIGAGGGTSAVSPPTRQTVLTGPASAGTPSFWPSSTSGTLTLTTQGVSSTSPLVLACAKGFGTAGAIDQVVSFTSNQSVTLPASATPYVYYDCDALAWSNGTLAPIYQYGGTISTASGQFTFDIAAMVGWVGNGSTAVRANRVYVGQATTSASAVTATIPYAYNGRFISQPINPLPTTAQSFTVSHNLGVNPVREARLFIENVTPEYGFSAGDRLFPTNSYANQQVKPVLQLWTSRLATGFYLGTDNTLYLNYTRDGTQVIAPTTTKWSAYYTVERGW